LQYVLAFAAFNNINSEYLVIYLPFFLSNQMDHGNVSRFRRKKSREKFELLWFSTVFTNENIMEKTRENNLIFLSNLPKLSVPYS
jgi:hypothetical protein